MEPITAGRVIRRAAIALLSLLTLAPINAATPKLTVLVVVEQFRADYLERSGSELGPGGLRRLIGGGAYFPRTRFETAASWTAPAAATIATGAWANGHGIVADAWFDRTEGRVVRATESARGPAPTRQAPSRPQASRCCAMRRLTRARVPARGSCARRAAPPCTA